MFIVAVVDAQEGEEQQVYGDSPTFPCNRRGCVCVVPLTTKDQDVDDVECPEWFRVKGEGGIYHNTYAGLLEDELFGNTTPSDPRWDKATYCVATATTRWNHHYWHSLFFFGNRSSLEASKTFDTECVA